jgi:sterol desaturase/sphingolipid hydroxylase (fatty acid hydroxylase superfamily)
MNLTAAVRLGWTGNISGNFLFYLPLVWLGFHPLMVLGMLAINLLYQFFIHTERVGRLGPLEWILNTPTHHCVHHAANPACLDMNYGGVLIVFDRLFGTFTEAPRDEPLRYGVIGGRITHNPFEIAFAEWRRLFRDAARASTLRARLKVLLGPPA